CEGAAAAASPRISGAATTSATTALDNQRTGTSGSVANCLVEQGKRA
ncbi:MAG: hypothetical protein AVDCRST_MAG88-3287, partial [uncultured Thermomicrobiales bacterium]